MGYKEMDVSKVRDTAGYVKRESNDACTWRFIHIMASDPDLDYRLSRLLLLFATDMPETYGGYAHHRR